VSDVPTQAASAGRLPVGLAVAVAGFALVAGLTVAFPGHMTKIGPALFVLAALAAMQRWLLRWQNLVGLVVLMVLFIPMDRYSFPVTLPVQLEPYRIVVGLLILAWLTSLALDDRVKARRTGFEGPLGLFVFAIVASLATNMGRAESVMQTLLKTLMFWVTYLFVVYALPSILRRVDIDLICKLLAGGGALVAVAAIVESRTNYNVFNHLTTFMPFLRLGQIPLTTTDLTAVSRGGRPRAYASAQHPIAMGAAFVVLLPFAFYLAMSTGKRRWWLAAALMLFGLFATVSRTGFMMLAFLVLIFFWLRHKELKRYWPALIPLIGVLHFAVPGTFGTVFQSFFPKGGLVAQQAGTGVGHGRIATLKPVLRQEFYPNPIFGEGFGTRISGDNGPDIVSNAPILDDEWANVLVQTGIVGTFALIWLLVRSVRMLARMSREEPGPRGWLPAGLAAAIGSYGIGMLTFDAFSFDQVTFLFFLCIGLAGVLYNARLEEAEVPALAPAGAPSAGTAVAGWSGPPGVVPGPNSP